jgi:alpha-D-ribose 1-methylphosphonate 5-triphosphate diphosphatase
MSEELILRNARIVLADEVVEGSVLVRDGIIADIAGASAKGQDLDGDYLLPGLVELHTDHMEGHYAPRPGVRWNPAAAVQAHDAQVAASGITTVLDALRIGLNDDSGMMASDFVALGAAIHAGMDNGRLRADHYIHLRCEVSAPDCLESFEPFAQDSRVRLASLMDHSPGQRQFASIEAYRNYYQKKKRMSDAEFAAFADRRSHESATYAAPNRHVVAAACAERGITVASHDDATLEHVADADAHGIRIAEFPTTMTAARASREAGMSILMGAPNVVRGGSHSGNVSARDLANEGLLDILSSDYVPLSLMQAVFAISNGDDAIALPDAVALVTRHPAAAAGFADRGTIAIGNRADLVRVSVDDGLPIIRTVWRSGTRVI